MKYPIWLGSAAAVLVACLMFAGVYQMSGSRLPIGLFTPAVAAVPASSHVKVNPGGSGTHIGGGFIITATHVVGKATSVTVTGDNGTEYEADVLWANKAYDVALLKLKAPAAVGVSPLSCAPNHTGQKVQAFGNPMGVKFVYTRGEVNGPARQFGPWQRVVPLDMTTIYGQSGGGIIDQSGNLVGVTVGLLPTPYGIGAFGWAVPAESVCMLLGRA
jgi:S1-C subfamily serine protease